MSSPQSPRLGYSLIENQDGGGSGGIGGGGTGAGIGLGGGGGDMSVAVDPTALFQSEKSRLAVADLDVFFTRLYNYWHSHGLWGSILSSLLNLLTFLFIIVFATFLYFVDWDALWLEQPVLRLSAQRLAHPSLFVILSMVVFSGVWLFRLVRFCYEMSGIFATYKIVSRKLQIADRDIRAMKWAEVVEKVEELQQRRTISVMKDLDALDIANRIMRKDNFMIAMVNLDLFDFRLPILGQQPLTKILEWNLLYALDFFFDFGKARDVKRDLLIPAQQQPAARLLQRRFFLLGLANLLAAPFLLIFLIFYLLFRYGEEFHGNPSSMLGAREWTPWARWQLREFNELPHAFAARLAAAYKPSSIYVNLFPSHIVNTVVRFFAFMVSAMSVVLLAIGLVDDDVMTKADIFGKNFLWFLTVFGVVLAASRGFVGEEETGLDPETAMRTVSHHTHYMPDSWRDRAHTYTVLDQFTTMFRYRVVVLLLELASVLTTPFVLMFALPRRAESLVKFVREYSAEMSGVGTVCHYATFDFRHAGDAMYGSGVDPQEHKHPAVDGKMEKSFVNFAAQHPRWMPNEQGQEFLAALVAHQKALTGMLPAVGGTGAVMLAQSRVMQHALAASMTAAPLAGSASASGEVTAPKLVPPHAVLFPLLDSFHVSNKQAALQSALMRTTQPAPAAAAAAAGAGVGQPAPFFLGGGMSRLMPSTVHVAAHPTGTPGTPQRGAAALPPPPVPVRPLRSGSESTEGGAVEMRPLGDGATRG